MSKYYTEKEVVALILEKCNTLNLEFLGFVEVPYITKNNRVKLRCKIHGIYWETTSVDWLLTELTGGVCCVAERALARRRYRESSIKEKFNLENNHKKLLDCISPGCWTYRCLICEKDIFASMGQTSVFKDYLGNFRKGQSNCRCGPRYRWSQEQRKIQINNRIAEESLPYVFMDWVGDVEFQINCLKHNHTWKVKCNTFLNMKYGCQKCSKSGFDKSKYSVFYVMKITGAESFTGYGISSNFDSRYKQHINKLEKAGCVVEEYVLFPMIGEEAFNLEKSFKQKYNPSGTRVEGFKTESCNINFEDFKKEVIQFNPT